MIPSEQVTQLTKSEIMVKTLVNYLQPRGYEVKVTKPSKISKCYKVMYRKVR